MITSVDHLKTMDPGRINANMLHFCTKTSVAEIIWVELIFSQNCFRTDAMEERNVCNTNFEKSCELVEVGIV